jgi:hypothetical protein
MKKGRQKEQLDSLVFERHFWRTAISFQGAIYRIALLPRVKKNNMGHVIDPPLTPPNIQDALLEMPAPQVRFMLKTGHKVQQ